MYFKAFYKDYSSIIFEKCVVTPNFLCWILITLAKIYISYIIINRGKNIFELIGTVLKLLILWLHSRDKTPMLVPKQ